MFALMLAANRQPARSAPKTPPDRSRDPNEDIGWGGTVRAPALETELRSLRHAKPCLNIVGLDLACLQRGLEVAHLIESDSRQIEIDAVVDDPDWAPLTGNLDTGPRHIIERHPEELHSDLPITN
jgi:hypothetical protein